MSDASIPMLSRQSGLLETAQIIANNIANASTPGYKSEGVIFSEYVKAAGEGNPSLSMGHLTARSVDFTPGVLRKTGGTFDLALSGEGFFKVLTPEGERLTRAGVFLLNPEGTVVDPNGFPLTDNGGGEIALPLDATNIAIASDGTLSVNGEIFGQVGAFTPNGEMRRAGLNLWISDEGTTAIEEPTIVQGSIEQSNVNPVLEFARLIEAQRQFEAGQNAVQQENERLEKLINAIRQQG